MQDLLAEVESSDLSVAEFARQRGIAAHRLYWARRRARAAAVHEVQDHDNDFAEAIVAPSNHIDHAAIAARAPVRTHVAPHARLRRSRSPPRPRLPQVMLSFPPSPQVKVFVCRKPVDMRKSFGGLSGAVIDVVDHDPQSGHLFLFFNRRRTMMKALIWESSGYWVLAKRLTTGRFQVFDCVHDHDARFEITTSELALLLDGIDLRGANRQQARREVMKRLSSLLASIRHAVSRRCGAADRSRRSELDHRRTAPGDRATASSAAANAWPHLRAAPRTDRPEPAPASSKRLQLDCKSWRTHRRRSPQSPRPRTRRVRRRRATDAVHLLSTCPARRSSSTCQSQNGVAQTVASRCMRSVSM